MKYRDNGPTTFNTIIRVPRRKGRRVRVPEYQSWLQGLKEADIASQKAEKGQSSSKREK